MAGRAPHAELTAVRALVAAELAVIGEAGDTGQIWVRSACARLSAFDGVLAEAAGVLAGPVQVIVATLVMFLVVAGSAALATVFGLGAAGVLAASSAALLTAAALTPRAGRRVTAVLGRRRLARAARSRPPITPPAPAGFFVSAGDGLTFHATGGAASALEGVPERLLRARVRLVSAAMRQAGTDDWTVPLLRRAIRHDPVIRRLAHADQLLCQAVDCIERHLGDLRKDPA